MQPPYPPDSYRYANESLILSLTLLLVAAVILITATATVCASVIFIAAAVALVYASSRSQHQSLLRSAYPVNTKTTPNLAAVVRQAASRINPGEIEVFVARSRELNAYAFGLDTPKVIVLYSALLHVMDEDELRFIIGHEMGHVALGHTWLNSLVGGMAGIPATSSASALLALAFLWWNRTCELSADRAGLLACGKPEKAISALIKLVAGPQGNTPAGLELAYRRIDAEDDTIIGSLNEALGNHPMLIRRINEIRRFSASRRFRSFNLPQQSG
jgi:Zn-dependent protease with chaperone function